MSKNTKQTSSRIATLAAETLQNERASRQPRASQRRRLRSATVANRPGRRWKTWLQKCLPVSTMQTKRRNWLRQF